MLIIPKDEEAVFGYGGVMSALEESHFLYTSYEKLSMQQKLWEERQILLHRNGHCTFEHTKD